MANDFDWAEYFSDSAKLGKLIKGVNSTSYQLSGYIDKKFPYRSASCSYVEKDYRKIMEAFYEFHKEYGIHPAFDKDVFYYMSYCGKMFEPPVTECPINLEGKYKFKEANIKEEAGYFFSLQNLWPGKENTKEWMPERLGTPVSDDTYEEIYLAVYYSVKGKEIPMPERFCKETLEPFSDDELMDICNLIIDTNGNERVKFDFIKAILELMPENQKLYDYLYTIYISKIVRDGRGIIEKKAKAFDEGKLNDELRGKILEYFLKHPLMKEDEAKRLVICRDDIPEEDRRNLLNLLANNPTLEVKTHEDGITIKKVNEEKGACEINPSVPLAITGAEAEKLASQASDIIKMLIETGDPETKNALFKEILGLKESVAKLKARTGVKEI